MALRMTEEEYKELIRRRTPVSVQIMKPEVPKRSKYGNKKTEIDGVIFDSAHEARVWNELKLDMQAGAYKGVARQVTFQLPGAVKYIADFVTFNQDGTFTVMDAKSPATRNNAVYRLKKKQMANCLGIEIKEV